MTKKITVLIFLLYFCLLQIALSENKTIKVGAILPLTGPIGFIGVALRQGIELAAKEATDIQFEVIIEDDQTANRVQAINATKKLAAIDRVDVVLNAYVSTLSAIYPTLRQAKIPTVIIWDSNKSIPSFGDYAVGFGYSNELAGADMAEYAINTKKHKKTAIIYFHDEWAELVAKSYSAHFKALGGEVALEETVDANSTDFRALIARAKVAKAEALYLALYGTGLHSAIKQARELKFTGDIFTPDSFGDYDIIQTGSAGEGVFATQVWLENTSFTEKHQRHFPSSKYSGVNLGYVALAYDSMKFIEAVARTILQSGRNLNSESIAKTMREHTFNGVLGKVTIANDGTTSRREGILQVKHGKFVKITG